MRTQDAPVSFADAAPAVSLSGPATVTNEAATWLRRWGPVALAGVILLGLAVRVRQYCAAPSFWYDEAYVLVNITQKGCAELAGPLRCEQAAPPLFLWVLRGLYLWAGPSEWAMRLPAFLASVLALAVFLPLARQVAGSPGWLWAVAFCALSYHAVTHGVEVKPYAVDLLMSSLVLLAASTWVVRKPGRPTPWGCWARLLGVGLLGPWASYPSVFLLGGASLALLADAGARKDRPSWLVWAGFNAVVLFSAAAVWGIAARHQRTTALQLYWQSGFVDRSSAAAALWWGIDVVVRIGHYGSTGLGVPLALLGLVGLVALGRRSPALVALLTGPLALAFVANWQQVYPLDDRLLFFAAPCLWLAAAFGVSVVLGRLHGKAAWVGLALLAALLLSDGVRTGRDLVLVQAKAEFREAIAFVQRVMSPEDLWWVSTPEIAEVYCGGRTCLGGTDQAEMIAEAARGKRLWLVASVPERGPVLPPELVRQLEGMSLTVRRYHQLRTIMVFCCTPAGTPAPPPFGAAR